MFQLGDFIVYGSVGVCRVDKIGTPETTSADLDKLYYTLCPVYSTEVIFTPVDTPVFMRPVISRAQAEELILQIPSIRETVCRTRTPSSLREHYEASFQTHNCEDLIQLIKSVYAKNMTAVQNGKKLGQVDQRYRKRAEDLLHGELSVALEIPIEEVVSMIDQIVAESAEENAVTQ